MVGDDSDLEYVIKEIRLSDLDEEIRNAKSDQFRNQSVVPNSVERLLDVEENGSRVVRKIEVVYDVLCDPSKLQTAAVLPTETVLDIGEDGTFLENSSYGVTIKCQR